MQIVSGLPSTSVKVSLRSSCHRCNTSVNVLCCFSYWSFVCYIIYISLMQLYKTSFMLISILSTILILFYSQNYFVAQQ